MTDETLATGAADQAANIGTESGSTDTGGQDATLLTEAGDKTTDTVEGTSTGDTDKIAVKPAIETKSDDATSQETQDTDTVTRIVPGLDEYVLPEGVPKQIAEFALANDMTQAQLDQSLQYFGSIIDNNQKGLAETIRMQGNQHVEKWGEKKDYNLSLVRRSLKQNDPDGTMRKMLDDSGYSNHPVILEFFLNLGSSMKEGGFLKGAVNTPPGQKSAAQSMFGQNHPSN